MLEQLSNHMALGWSSCLADYRGFYLEKHLTSSRVQCYFRKLFVELLHFGSNRFLSSQPDKWWVAWMAQKSGKVIQLVSQCHHPQSYFWNLAPYINPVEELELKFKFQIAGSESCQKKKYRSLNIFNSSFW